MALGNKLGITDSRELARAEEQISKAGALALLESGLLETLEAGSFRGLARIHEALFGEIYEFAGKIRDVNLRLLLGNALTDRITDREVYVKGIDASYYYEGYDTCKTEDC